MITNLEALKTQANIIDIISAYIPLKKAGVNYTACCPFHNEKTPSFMVNENKQIFKCFGCGEGGDVFSFVQKIEKIDFNEAALRIAQMSNFRLEFDTKQAGSNPSEILERVNAFAKAELKKQAILCQYLYERGFNESDIDTYDIGYLPPKKELLAHFSESELLSANIANEYEKGIVSIPLHHRIIFAIRNPFHKIIAFVGRTHNAYEFNKNAPKYINSKESYFYKKSQILYMYSNAKSHIAKEKKAFIVEGYIDCLMLHKVGIAYALATGGTAFNVQHLNLLTRLGCEIIFCFDNDRSGMEANFRAIEVCFKAGVYNISIALLRNKKNSALGSHLADLGICEEARTLSPLTSPQIPKNHQSNTANPRILENNQAQTLESKEGETSTNPNTQTQIASQRENLKRSEIIALGGREKRLPKRKSGGFCLFGALGLGGNPFSFCDENPKTLESLRSENIQTQITKKPTQNLCKDINEALMSGQELDFKILSGFAFYTKMLFKKFPKPQAFDILKDKIKGIENYYIREAFISEASEILGINPLEFTTQKQEKSHKNTLLESILKSIMLNERAAFIAQHYLTPSDMSLYQETYTNHLKGITTKQAREIIFDESIRELKGDEFVLAIIQVKETRLKEAISQAKACKDIDKILYFQNQIKTLQAKRQNIYNKPKIIEVVNI